MTKTELMETYTAEELAEMVVDLQNIPTAGEINCENSGNSDLIKVKCDKCGEEFLAFLDEKYILCKKTEFFGTQDANKQLNKDVEILQSEVEKYRKSFEDAKKERDCRIAEYQNGTEKDKTELERAKNTINQIDDILEKLFGVRHDTVDKPDEFEKILSDRAKGNVTDFFPTEPIKVAEMLINEFRKGDNYTYLGISELRQIAEHLLVYCNHNGEAEE